MKFLGRSIAALLIIIGSFFGTMFLLDYFESRTPNAQRAMQVQSVKSALEKHRALRGAYPFPFLDAPLTEVAKLLIERKLLETMPIDPVLGTSTYKQYRYNSNDGKSYGLLVFIQPDSADHQLVSCLTGVGTAGTGWWGQPANCPF